MIPAVEYVAAEQLSWRIRESLLICDMLVEIASGDKEESEKERCGRKDAISATATREEQTMI